MELDQDLAARQEARDLCAAADTAARQLSGYCQQQLDRIVESVARAFSEAAQELAELAAEETGFGNGADKTVKNRFASLQVARRLEGMRCVGVLKRCEREKLWEVGVPVGVIGAIVPSTNPTATVCYKALIALKSGNAIVFSPHPKALRCTVLAARIVAEAAVEAGAPEGAVGCLSFGSMAGCRELMAAEPVRLILATGGPSLVKAAYTSGKPAIGVGAGNGPAYIHPSADMDLALRCILRSKTFDNGTVCASEQSIIAERAIAAQVEEAAKGMGYYFMDPREADRLGKLLFRPTGALSPDIVGKTALQLAERAGISVPPDTKILVARETGVGPEYPYSMEKLCPVLAFYTVENQQQALDTVLQVLHHEGAGHTFTIHASDTAAVETFAAAVPVSRILVNTPAALGGIGATTGLFPALTLGCGAVGGSASSNNIGPMDLVNIRRVAWDTEQPPDAQPDPVEALAQKILQHLR